MKLKLTRTKFVMILLFLGVFVIVRYAMRDIEIDLNLLRQSIVELPGMVMQNMRFKREVSGDIWNVTIPYIERRNSLVSVRSLDVRREIGAAKVKSTSRTTNSVLPSRGEWYFFAQEGLYSEDEQVAVLYNVLGTLDLGNIKDKESLEAKITNDSSLTSLTSSDRVMNLETSRVDWTASRDEIVFPQGLSLFDQEFLISATTASMDYDGVILFDNGGSIQWTKPLDWDSDNYPDDLESVFELGY